MKYVLFMAVNPAAVNQVYGLKQQPLVAKLFGQQAILSALCKLLFLAVLNAWNGTT